MGKIAHLIDWPTQLRKLTRDGNFATPEKDVEKVAREAVEEAASTIKLKSGDTLKAFREQERQTLRNTKTYGSVRAKDHNLKVFFYGKVVRAIEELIAKQPVSDLDVAKSGFAPQQQATPPKSRRDSFKWAEQLRKLTQDGKKVPSTRDYEKVAFEAAREAATKVSRGESIKDLQEEAVGTEKETRAKIANEYPENGPTDWNYYHKAIFFEKVAKALEGMS
ncbi:hypothetical protein B0T19DRAFT_446177 [Cercophora scortea]|uniref:Uncharacterized protein n=1 Tax=Cercophora scortea TaxID=314031 RepID=A0AAE0I249_9PEZI|nr:hypothetical protein B0T19DRAFT_446177 [Cercophora scortea]